MTMQQLASGQNNAHIPVNSNFQSLEHQSVYGQRQLAHSGLTWGFYGGRWGGFLVADGTLALSDGATNYVVVAVATGVISVSTATTNWNDGTGYRRVYRIVTAGGVVTNNGGTDFDYRAGPGGVHGSLDIIAAGLVIGPASAVDSHFAQFDGTTGELLKGGLALDTDTALTANSNTRVPSQAAVKAYADAVMAYADALVTGLSWKQAVRAATVAAGTLASSFANGQTIDGVSLVTGNRILIKNQAAPAENGIYIVAASGAPTRSTDANSGAELVNATVYVSEGTTLADTQWTCATNAPITPDTTGLTFAQLTSGGGGGTKTYAVLSPMTSQPPLTNFATLDTRNNIAVLDFDANTEESIFWTFIMPEGAVLGSGLLIRIHWMATSATSGDTRWGVKLERMNTDLDADSYDTILEGVGTANGTSGIITVTALTLTTIDSATAGDACRLSVARIAAAGSDTMTGDAELVLVEVRSAV